jgi:ATP-dependent DNA helicase RecG
MVETTLRRRSPGAPPQARFGCYLNSHVHVDGCASLPVTDELLRNLAQMRDDGNLLPLPSLSVEKRAAGGCEFAVVAVEPSTSPPVRDQGRVWIKVGPTVRQATPEVPCRE